MGQTRLTSPPRGVEYRGTGHRFPPGVVSIKDELASQELGEDLESLITLVIRINIHLREQLNEQLNYYLLQKTQGRGNIKVLEHEGQTIQHQDTIKHVSVFPQPSLCVRLRVHNSDIKYIS